MNWIRNILVVILVGANLFFVFLYKENQGEVRPNFFFHPNLVVGPSPFGFDMDPDIINALIVNENGDRFMDREAFVALLTKAYNNSDDVIVRFRKSSEAFRGNIPPGWKAVAKTQQTKTQGQNQVEPVAYFEKTQKLNLSIMGFWDFVERNWIYWITINLFLVFMLYFYTSAYDLYLTVFMGALVLFLGGYMSLVNLGYGVTLYFMGIYLYPAAMFNLARSLAGREVPHWVSVAMAVLMATLIFIGHQNFYHYDLYLYFMNFNLMLIGFTIFGSVGYFTYKAIQHRHNRRQVTKFFWFSFVYLLGVGLPVGIFAVLKGYDYGLSWLLFYFSLLFFPLGIVFVGYRYQLLPLKKIFSKSLVYTFVLAVLSILYAAVIYLYNILLPHPLVYRDILPHVLFVLVLVFLLDPITSFASRFFKREIFKAESELASRLEQLALLVSNPGQIEKSIVHLLGQIKTGIGLNRSCLLLTTDTFQRLAVDDGTIIRLNHQEIIWDLVRDNNKIIMRQHLRTRGPKLLTVHDFLDAEGFDIMLPVFSRQHNEAACLLISGKRDNTAFSLEELNFLQHASNMANLLFQNYLFQMADIKRRRRNRELEISSEVQLSLLPAKIPNLKNFDLEYFSIPASGVTGDYLDFFRINRDELILLTGDVTGHGLGPAYLMSASRTIIRSYFKAGMNLEESVERLNDFLMTRYGGSEFMTLFAGRLNLVTGELKYINAGHPPPVYYRRSTKRMTRLIESQRLLGVAPTSYKLQKQQLEKDDMLFVFSDGLLELFNPAGKTFGWPRLNALLRTLDKTDLTKYTGGIVRSLKRFKKDEEWSDDTTFMVVRRRK